MKNLFLAAAVAVACAVAVAADVLNPGVALLGWLIPCLPAQNVVATGKATISFANLLGFTVEFILLELGGGAFTKAMITGIDIKANTKTIFNNSGSRQDDQMEYRGETASASYLVVPFDESRGRTECKGVDAKGQLVVIDGEKVGSIDTTQGIQSLTGEIDISGATTPTLKAYAEVSAAPAPDARFRSLIAKTHNFTLSPAAAGEFLFDVPQGRAPGAIIKRIFLHGSTVTGYRVKKNGITITEVNSAALNTYQQQREGRVPQANVQCIDFIKDGNQSSALMASDARNMEYYLTVSGAGNVVVVPEFYDLLNNN